MINSLQNQRVKDAIKLRGRRQRDRQGRFLIDGARELSRAMQTDIELVDVFVCEECCESTDSNIVLKMLPESRVDVQQVSRVVYEKMAFGNRVEGVLAVAKIPNRELNQIQLPEVPLVAILEGIEKPGNVGAILRSADAAGVSALILVDAVTDLFNPNCIRASLGTVFSMPIAEATGGQVVGWLHENRMTVFAARVDADLRYDQADFTQPAALVFGSEADGLSLLWLEDDVVGINLPMRGIADSLNVSATASVLFYEALRQRRE